MPIASPSTGCLALLATLLAPAALAQEGSHVVVRDLGLLPTASALRDAPLPEGAWHVRVGRHLFTPADNPALPTSADAYRLVPGRDAPGWTEPYRVLSDEGWTLLAFPEGVPDPWPTAGELLPPGYGGEALPTQPGSGLCRAAGDGLPVAVDAGLEIGVPFRAPASARRVAGIPESVVAGYVSSVTNRRYSDTIADLVGFGQRNSYTAGNLSARDYIRGRLESHGLVASTPQFTVSGSQGSTPGFNVVGVQVGTLHPDEFIVVGAHYDSLPNPPSASPGAEDNASGTAAVLEMARILSAGQHQRTIVYIAFSGEEQGLDGSAAYVASLSPSQRDNLVAAITMDMVSYTADAQLDVLLETFPFAAWLRDELALAAQDYTTLAVFTSFNPFGSDHMPFLNNGLPGILLIENDWDVYPQYHRVGDTASQLTIAQGTEILRMAVATTARLANPTSPGAGTNWTILAE